MAGGVNGCVESGVEGGAAAASMAKRYRQLQAGSHSVAAMASVNDQLDRPMGVLRLSLTARCNLACPYCLPDGVEPPGLLTLPQRLAVIEAAVALGVTSLRLTGGEPLLHSGLEDLVAAVQPLRRQGLREIALTSNGALLSGERARTLRQAGLDRITLSLDGASGEAVAAMAGLSGGEPAGEALLAKVLAAIEHARAAGFAPERGELKLNAVIQRGRNEDQLLPLADLARQRGIELRLIEFMDVGNRNGWTPEVVVSAAEMVAVIAERWPLLPLGRGAGSTARRWRYCDRDTADSGGTLAVVASITAPFCGDCNRLRVTADGLAYTCLFAAPGSGLDLRPWLTPEAGQADLREALAGLWRQRSDRWSEERLEVWNTAGPPANGPASAEAPRHAEMAYLGG
jgi:cyclic pyranopterin phosphate synthase